MSQVNVNPGGGTREYREVRERSGWGAGAVAMAIIGVVLLLALLWFAMSQGWFGGSTTVVNQPAERVERSSNTTVVERDRQVVPQAPAGNTGANTGTNAGSNTGTTGARPNTGTTGTTGTAGR
ncbi:MAG TPA: hypothetical protein VGW38_08115 [Chloroflexota bacterium]|nr:hypothetical protein [Chloroflexota bacterium]